MGGDDGDIDIVDTSDNDERELLLAENDPAYYRRCWGEDSQDAQRADISTETNDLLVFTRLNISGASKEFPSALNDDSPFMPTTGHMSYGLNGTQLSQANSEALAPLGTPTASRTKNPPVQQEVGNGSRVERHSSPDPLSLFSPPSGSRRSGKTSEIAHSQLTTPPLTAGSGLGSDSAPSPQMRESLRDSVRDGISEETCPNSPIRISNCGSTASTRIDTPTQTSVGSLQSQEKSDPISQQRSFLHSENDDVNMEVDNGYDDFEPINDSQAAPPVQEYQGHNNPAPQRPIVASQTPSFRLFRSRSLLTPLPPMRSSPASDHAEPLRTKETIEIPPDTDAPNRKYSLRNRSAKQLKPFEYEKRQYKHLLRAVPEAIVKDPSASGMHSGRRRRYEGEEDATQIELEGEEEDVDVQREKERRRQIRLGKQKAQENRTVILREFGITLSESEEEDGVGAIQVSQDGANTDFSPRGKKRKREHKPKDFPMPARKEAREASTSARASTPPEQSVPKRRPMPNTPPNPDPSLGALSPDEMQFDLGDEGWLDDLPQGPKKPPPKEMSASSQHGNATNDAESSRSSPRVRIRRGPRPAASSSPEFQIIEKNSSTNTSSNGESSTEEPNLVLEDRVKLKALNRMMPKFMINRLLQGNTTKPKKTENHPRRQDSEEAAPRPGHGRKRMVPPGFRDPRRYDIEGDTESEPEVQSDGPENDQLSHRGRSPGVGESTRRARSEGENNNRRRGSLESREVIVIPSDTGSSSEDGLDADDIHTWLAPPSDDGVAPLEEVHEVYRRRQGGSNALREGDLIDRMLQRTRRVGAAKKSRKSSEKRSSRADHHRTGDRKKDYGTKNLRQIVLPFSNEAQQSTSKSKRHRKQRTDSRSVASGHSPQNVNGNEHPIGDGQALNAVAELATKKRKQKHKTNGLVYINQNEGRRVTSGRQRDPIHIDLNDEDLNLVLTPTEKDELAIRKPAKRNKNAPRRVHQFLQLNHPEPDDFNDSPGSAHPQNNSVDCKMSLLPSGIKVGTEGYISKGRLYELLEFLGGNSDVQKPSRLMLPDLLLDPDASIGDLTSTLATSCDRLYHAAVMLKTDEEWEPSWRMVETLMYTMRHTITYRVINATSEERGILTTTVSEHLRRLVGRVEEQLEITSGDGYNMDFRLFSLYWFTVEVQLRLAYAQKIATNSVDAKIPPIAEENMVQFVRRLLEFGFDRTLGPVQKEGLSFNGASQDSYILELWICVLNIARFFPANDISNSSPPFWRLLETAIDRQSNLPDAQLPRCECLWDTVFSLCAISQFSPEGISTSIIRLEPHWSFIKKMLKSIRLSADPNDNGKDVAILRNRDNYLKAITRRCFLLSSRWTWDTSDTSDILKELCSVFRSRLFSNLLNEAKNDFPEFITEKDENLMQVYQSTDTAYALFLKMIVRAANGFAKLDRRQQLTRLLILVIPVGSTPFSKQIPPVGQDLSMLYNRYSIIYVAIYVDPQEQGIRTRLQQARRYIVFKDADCDSRSAAIRAMTFLAILLRHLQKPLDDILEWISEMLDDLLEDMAQVGNSQNEKNELILTVVLLLASVRSILGSSSLNQFSEMPHTYPEIKLMQVWMSRLLVSPYAKDHRSGEAMCKCIASFLEARNIVIPPAPPVKPKITQNSLESLEDYGDFGFDMDDPSFQQFLENTETEADQHHIPDQKASEIFDTFSQPFYSCLCSHLGCDKIIEPRRGPYYEAETWIEAWIGIGDLLVRHKRKKWSYYLQLFEPLWKGFTDPFRQAHVRLEFCLFVMRIDPGMYGVFQDQILLLWFETSVAPDTHMTLQDQFTAQLFNADSLEHLLLRNMPCEIGANTDRFNFNLDQFLELRPLLIQRALENVSASIDITQSDKYVSLVESMVISMQKYSEALTSKRVDASNYIRFRNEVMSVIRRQLSLSRHPKIQGILYK